MRSLARVGSWVALLAVLGACGGGSGAPPGPGPGSLTVSGTVVNVIGQPAANVPVVIDGQDPVATDVNGAFQVPGVRVPYDAIVLDGSGGGAVVWRGLTRADPIFSLDVGGGGLPVPTSSASVAGVISGGVGLPIPLPPPDIVTDVNFWVTSSNLFGAGSATPDTVTGIYSQPSLQWAGIAPFQLTITALQYTLDGAGLAVTFDGYGQLTTPINNGDALVGQNINMVAVPATPITGTTTLPPSIVALARIVFLNLPGGGLLTLPSDTGGTPGFTLQAPDVPGLKRRLITFGLSAANEAVFHLTDQLPAPAPALTIELPNIVGPVLPVDGVTGVDYSTVFTASTPLDDLVLSVRFEPSGGGPGPEIRLVTAESEFTIPDLSAYGITIPPGAQYDWRVGSQGPATSVDDVAVGPVFLTGLFFGTLGGEWIGTDAMERSFFFAP